MAAVAGLRATDRRLDQTIIDLILLATLTPDYWMPDRGAREGRSATRRPPRST
jgi:3-oxoacyl-[acyl-carrier-protein] synthase III